MDDEVIRSLTNPLVKRLVRLRERRAREREGVTVVEGARELARALEGGWPLELLAWCPERFSDEARAQHGALLGAASQRRRLAPEAFDKASRREGPDGLIGLLRPRRFQLDELAWPPDGLYLVVAGLEKPGNVGALLRSADAAGCDAVFVTGAGTDLANPNVVRASMGSLFSRPVLALDDDSVREALRQHGVRIVATSPAARTRYWSLPLTGPVAIVIGAEHAGLDAAWLEAADALATIPMRGRADSLNAATAGALVLFEALRQRDAAAASLDGTMTVG